MYNTDTILSNFAKKDKAYIDVDKIEVLNDLDHYLFIKAYETEDLKNPIALEIEHKQLVRGLVKYLNSEDKKPLQIRVRAQGGFLNVDDTRYLEYTFRDYAFERDLS